MTWTYDPTLATDRDKVRFGIQDTEEGDPLFADEEIAATMTAVTSVDNTILSLAKKLLLKYARQVDTSVGRVSESASQRYAAMKEIVSRLEGELTLAMPEFGGVSNSENDALDQDTDLVQQWETREGTTNLGSRSTFGGGGST